MKSITAMRPATQKIAVDWEKGISDAGCVQALVTSDREYERPHLPDNVSLDANHVQMSRAWPFKIQNTFINMIQVVAMCRVSAGLSSQGQDSQIDRSLRSTT